MINPDGVGRCKQSFKWVTWVPTSLEKLVPQSCAPAPSHLDVKKGGEANINKIIGFYEYSTTFICHHQQSQHEIQTDIHRLNPYLSVQLTKEQHVVELLASIK